MTFQVDRSRVLDFQSCARKRYWGFHYAGAGIQRLSKSLPLVVGGALHEGLALLIMGKGIEAAVLRAQLELSNAFAAKGIVIEDASQAEHAMFEQGALVEGMLRAWEVHEGDQFREQFEIIEVEEEGRVDLGADIELMYRPDAVLRDRVGGDVFVLSWKSCSSYTQMTYNQASTDMQSLSEVYGVQKKHGLTVEGVLYKYIVKGRRSMDDYTGRYVQDSPLIYGWMRNNGPDTEWAFKYKWPSEEEGKKFSQLPKGFRKVSIWDNYDGGVKQWITDLAAREITPRHVDPMEMIFPQSLPVSRRPDEIESWLRQVVSQEGRVRARVKAVEESHGAIEVLDREFAQHSARCMDFNSKCQFWDACFVPSVFSNPLNSGLYQIRISNHPEKGESSAD